MLSGDDGLVKSSLIMGKASVPENDGRSSQDRSESLIGGQTRAIFHNRKSVAIQDIGPHINQMRINKTALGWEYQTVTQKPETRILQTRLADS